MASVDFGGERKGSESLRSEQADHVSSGVLPSAMSPTYDAHVHVGLAGCKRSREPNRLDSEPQRKRKEQRLEETSTGPSSCYSESDESTETSESDTD